MDILDDIRVSKLSAKVFLKVNYSFKMFTLLFKILGSVRFFNVFERSLVYSPRLQLFDPKLKKKTILKYYYNLKYFVSILKLNLLYSCNGKLYNI